MIVTRGYGSGSCLISRGFGLATIYEFIVLSSLIHLELIKNSLLHISQEILLSSPILFLLEMKSQIRIPTIIKSIIKTLRQFFSSIDTQKELDSRIDLAKKMKSKIDRPEE